MKQQLIIILLPYSPLKLVHVYIDQGHSCKIQVVASGRRQSFQNAMMKNNLGLITNMDTADTYKFISKQQKNIGQRMKYYNEEFNLT